MSLEAGTRLSHYEIVALLGKGGMGEVYRARDQKLGRDVAIKVLPDAVSASPEQISRLEREAKLLASLNHPNIATLYGLEDHEDELFLVLELVDGETLAKRIGRGPLPVSEAVPLFAHIAEGLEVAHQNGIIHRDLKPANVKIAEDGSVKILDFGLAKAFGSELASDASTESPTVTRRGTETGVILGTAAYMSPEQARGLPLDKTTDIWSFGCCLFEALTGQAPFLGDTVSDTIAAVLTREPDFGALPPATPTSLRKLLRRLLQKDARQRLRDIGDARIELSELTSDPPPSRDEGNARWALAPWWWAAAGVVAGAVLLWLARPSPEIPASVRHLELTTEPLAVGFQSAPAIAHDGETIVYASGWPEIYARSLSEPINVLVAGAAGGAPFLSHDGEWVASFRDRTLWKSSIRGGAPIIICETPGLGPRGGSWGEDGSIVFNYGWGSLMRVPSSGGTPEPLSALDAERNEIQHRFPHWLPDGRGVLFQVYRGARREEVALLDVATGDHRILVEDGSDPYYSSSGHLVFYRAGSIHAAGFDLETLRLTSSPIAVVNDVLRVPAYGTRAQYAVSESGHLIYVSATGVDARPRRSLVWIDLDGSVRAERGFTDYVDYPELSPDGERVALTLASPSAPNLWIAERARATLIPLTLGEALQGSWSPDGSRIAFVSSRHRGPYNLYWKRADDQGDTERLETRREMHVSPSWSPDGRHIAFVAIDGSGDHDIWIRPVDGGRVSFPFADAAYVETGPEFSPDGRWITYTSNRSGRRQVYVQPFPGPGEAQPVSTDGGQAPRWSPDGSRIYYFYDGWMMVAEVTAEPVFRASAPKRLFECPYAVGRYATDFKNYDVLPDGSGFLMVRYDYVPAPTKLHVVLNWREELKRLVPSDG